MKYSVEDWYTDETIVAFPTEEARDKWVVKNTHKEETTTNEEGFPFWKRVLNDNPNIRVALCEY